MRKKYLVVAQGRREMILYLIRIDNPSHVPNSFRDTGRFAVLFSREKQVRFVPRTNQLFLPRIEPNKPSLQPERLEFSYSALVLHKKQLQKFDLSDI